MNTSYAHVCAIVFCLLSASTSWAKDVVVGMSTPLSGPLESSGGPMRLGAKICFDAINAAGGINGNKIKFIAKDDQYKVSETLRLVKELIEVDKAVVLVGNVGTANNEALRASKLLDASSTALVAPRTGSKAVREPFYPNMFHIRASYGDEVKKLVQYLSTVGITKIGIVYQNDGLGLDPLEAAKRALGTLNLAPVFAETYERNTTKLEGAAKKALAAEPQAIMVFASTAGTSAFVKLYREGGGKANLMAISVTEAEGVIKNVGLNSAHGLAITTLFPGPSRNELSVVREYLDALKKYGPPNAVPSIVSLEGFISAKVVVEGLKRVGNNPTNSTVLNSLERLGDLDLGGFRVSYGPTKRSGSNYVDISIISKTGQVIH